MPEPCFKNYAGWNCPLLPSSTRHFDCGANKFGHACRQGGVYARTHFALHKTPAEPHTFCLRVGARFSKKNRTDPLLIRGGGPGTCISAVLRSPLDIREPGHDTKPPSTARAEGMSAPVKLSLGWRPTFDIDPLRCFLTYILESVVGYRYPGKTTNGAPVWHTLACPRMTQVMAIYIWTWSQIPPRSTPSCSAFAIRCTPQALCAVLQIRLRPAAGSRFRGATADFWQKIR